MNHNYLVRDPNEIASLITDHLEILIRIEFAEMDRRAALCEHWNFKFGGCNRENDACSCCRIFPVRDSLRSAQ